MVLIRAPRVLLQIIQTMEIHCHHPRILRIQHIPYRRKQTLLRLLHLLRYLLGIREVIVDVRLDGVSPVEEMSELRELLTSNHDGIPPRQK